MYQLQVPLSRDEILEKLSQEQIMERYTGLKVDTRKAQCSPFRTDRNPTCKFKYSRSGKLYFRDYAESEARDCFALVMWLHTCSFYEAIQLIGGDFGLRSPTPIQRIDYDIGDALSREPAIIRVKDRAFSELDKTYWFDRFGISRATLSLYRVFPLEKVWLDDTCVWAHTKNDPGYGYRLAKGEWKIYFPLRPRTKPRFMGNTPLVQGYAQLPDSGDLCILTKSMKDVMVLHTLGIPAVSYQSESILPDAVTIEALKSRFTTLYTLYDFDLAGIRTAGKIKRTYDIAPLYLANGRFKLPDWKAKDVAELVNKFGLADVKQVSQTLLAQHRANCTLDVEPLTYSPGHLMDVPF